MLGRLVYLTNPRIYKKGLPKTFENVDQAATELLKNRAMPTEKEIATLLQKADTLQALYFQLRAKAIIGLVKIFGKRRGELCLLEMADLTVEKGFLNVTFTICKKSKKGLFQYFEFLKKQGNPELLNKPLPILQQEHKKWNLTPEGTRLKQTKRPKQTPITDKYAKLIMTYFKYMKTTYPNSRFLFPSGREVFGSCYVIDNNRPLSGRQILNVVKQLDPATWVHLYRKLKGSEVARKYGRTLDSAYQVKTTLDLERTETALRYIEEFVPKLETGETS
jgi:integrase